MEIPKWPAEDQGLVVPAVGEACNGMRLVFALGLVVYAFAFGTPLRPLTLKARREIESEVYEELRSYLALAEDAGVADGLAPPEARSEARRALGDPVAIADDCVQIQDQHPLRMTFRALEAALTLTVGVGLAAAVFLLVNAVLFRAPVSFQDLDLPPSGDTSAENRSRALRSPTR